MKICRAFFRCENETESNLLLDIVLDGARKIPSKVPFFGSWGRLNSKSIYPFVLMNGRLDFGDESSEDSLVDHSSRFAEWEINDRIIACNELYILKYYGESYLMRLEKLTDMDRLLAQ